jgi:histidinol-phosphatase (PHP family)
MAESAVEKGFSILGFSGHSCNRPLDPDSMSEENTKAYLHDIAALQEEYKDRLEIVCGIEQDSLSTINRDDFAYVIGSVHYIIKDGIPYAMDLSQSDFDDILQDAYQGDIESLVKDYYDALTELIETEDFDIVGHLDLITKYNAKEKYFPFDAPWYLEAAKKAMDAGLKKNLIFEINTGAISRGYRKTPYPHPLLLEYLAKHHARICINTDCHNAPDLDAGLQQAFALAADFGITRLEVYENGTFCSKPIEAFADFQKKSADLKTSLLKWKSAAE